MPGSKAGRARTRATGRTSLTSTILSTPPRADCKLLAVGQERPRRGRNGLVMRNGTLHSALEAFTLDVSAALKAETAQGAEVPFEVVEEAGGPTPLYCYRARTGEFISERLGLLTALPTYAAAARAL